MGNKHEKTFNLTNRQRNTKENCTEILSHPGQNGNH